MKTVCASVVFGLALSTVAGIAQNKKKDGKGDEQLIQGVWKVVSSQDQGKPDDKAKGIIAILKDGKVTVKKGDETIGEGTYKLDPSKKPKWLDIAVPDKGTMLAIYELKGDTLKICHGDPDGKERPTRFASEADSANKVLSVLKRQKK